MDLKRCSAGIPERYGVVRAIVAQLPSPPDDGAFFAERMTVRLSAQAPINDPSSLASTGRRGRSRTGRDPAVVVERGNHSLGEARFVPVRGWYPIEVLHFPIRSHEQYARKAAQQVAAFAKNPRGYGTGYHEFAGRRSRRAVWTRCTRR